MGCRGTGLAKTQNDKSKRVTKGARVHTVLRRQQLTPKVATARSLVALNLDYSVQVTPCIRPPAPGNTQPAGVENHVEVVWAKKAQIAKKPLLGEADLQPPSPLGRPRVVSLHSTEGVHRQLFKPIRKQSLNNVENNISLGQVLGQAQLIDGSAGREPPVVHAKRLFGLGIKEVEVELSRLNKTEGHALSLGAGIPARAEEVSHRSCECCGPRVNVGDERRGRETVLFFFFGGAKEVMPPKDGPAHLGKLGAFVPKALDDVIEPRILISETRRKSQLAAWPLG